MADRAEGPIKPRTAVMLGLLVIAASCFAPTVGLPLLFASIAGYSALTYAQRAKVKHAPVVAKTRKPRQPSHW